MGEHSNIEICTVVLKKYNYIGKIISGRKCIPHSQPPLNVSVRIYIPHSHYKENICARWHNANSFEANVVCDFSLIQHGILLDSVEFSVGICHGVLSLTVCNRKTHLVNWPISGLITLLLIIHLLI